MTVQKARQSDITLILFRVNGSPCDGEVLLKALNPIVEALVRKAARETAWADDLTDSRMAIVKIEQSLGVGGI